MDDSASGRVFSNEEAKQKLITNTNPFTTE